MCFFWFFFFVGSAGLLFVFVSSTNGLQTERIVEESRYRPGCARCAKRRQPLLNRTNRPKKNAATTQRDPPNTFFIHGRWRLVQSHHDTASRHARDPTKKKSCWLVGSHRNEVRRSKLREQTSACRVASISFTSWSTRANGDSSRERWRQACEGGIVSDSRRSEA